MKETSLVTGLIIAAVAPMDGGGREDERVGPGGTADFRECDELKSHLFLFHFSA